MKRQDFVEGSALSETKEAAAQMISAGDIGSPATIGSFASIDRKSRMMVINWG
jgi:hypothetical protein